MQEAFAIPSGNKIALMVLTHPATYGAGEVSLIVKQAMDVFGLTREQIHPCAEPFAAGMQLLGLMQPDMEKLKRLKPKLIFAADLGGVTADDATVTYFLKDTRVVPCALHIDSAKDLGGERLTSRFWDSRPTRCELSNSTGSVQAVTCRRQRSV